MRPGLLRAALLAAALLPAAPLAAEEAPAPAADGGFAVLPEAWIHLRAARYFPVKEDLHWNGWIGAGAGLLKVAGVTAYVETHVETTIGNTRRAFDATQANYHLDAGARRAFGAWEAGIVFHHVSRHLSDRNKEQAVDWNILAGRVRRRLAERGWLEAQLGYTTQVSLVGYDVEGVVRGDYDVVRGRPGILYVRGELRGVKTTPSALFPRDGFLDLWAEGGVRQRRERRHLDLFAAFERRHDVLLEQPGALDRLLLGLRIGQER